MPGRLMSNTSSYGQNTQNNANTVTATGGMAGPNSSELSSLISRIFSRGDANLPAADKQELVNALAARTSLSLEEASSTVDRRQARAVEAQQQYQQAKATDEQKAREVGDGAVRSISMTAIWSFVALILLIGLRVAGNISVNQRLVFALNTFYSKRGFTNVQSKQ